MGEWADYWYGDDMTTDKEVDSPERRVRPDPIIVTRGSPAVAMTPVAIVLVAGLVVFLLVVLS